MVDIFVLSETELEVSGKRYRCAIGKAGFTVADAKREGDNKTPMGVYALREGWVRADKVQLPHLRTITEQDGWCDDPAHDLYNQPIIISSTIHGGGLGRGNYSTRNSTALKHAKTLRKNQTDAEQWMWSKLRRKQLGGYRFRRQYGIGQYIVDFVCVEQQLIVELDGGQHDGQKAYDDNRTAFLNRAGFEVLRFWNNEVFENSEGVLQVILDALNAPTQTLPRKRGGAKSASLFSYERLWRDDDCYDVIVPIGYNDDPVTPGMGSAIFFHIARDDFSGTEGCVAVSKDDMLEILPQLTSNSCIHILPNSNQ